MLLNIFSVEKMDGVDGKETDLLKPYLDTLEHIQAFSEGVTHRVSTPGPVENRASLFSIGSNRYKYL